MEDFIHVYEMESLQLGITARKEILEQVQRYYPKPAEATGLGRTDKALAARQAKQLALEDDNSQAGADAWTLVVAGNSKECFRNRMRNIHFVAIASAMEKHRLPGIRGLDLRYNHLGEEHSYDQDEEKTEHDERHYVLDTASRLGRMLTTYAIEDVNLSGNRIGGESCQLLCSMLQKEPTALQVLNLNSNPIGARGIHALADYLRAPCCSLRVLDLGNTELQIENIITISAALRENRTLQSLNLDNPVIKTNEEEAIQHIGKMLQVNDTLCSLSLAKHQLTDQGAQVLAERLLDNESLHTLILRANHIGATGAQALAAMIANHASLAHFDLSANRIGDLGAAAFAHVLELNTSNLLTLSLTSAYITDDGLSALAHACLEPRNPQLWRLRSLFLWGNDFGDKSAPLLLDLVEGAFQERAVETDVRPYRVDDTVLIAHKEVSMASPFASPKR